MAYSLQFCEKPTIISFISSYSSEITSKFINSPSYSQLPYLPMPKEKTNNLKT